jgi:hypothetical protein
LTTDPAPRSHFRLLTYVLSVRRLHLALVSYSIALGLTCGALWFSGLSLDKIQPEQNQLRDVAVLDAPGGTTDRTLRVEYNAPPAGSCVKFSQHLLRQMRPGTPTFYSLGSTMSGGGFGTPNGATLIELARRVKSQDFVQMLSIPASIPDGQYEYVYRSVYTCVWLGGLIQRRIPYEAPPVQIRIGPP